MACIWRGSLEKILWPHHHEHNSNLLNVSLAAEFWSMSENSSADLDLSTLRDVKLRFMKFTYASEIPIWSITDSEFRVFSRDPQSVQFFREFASIETEDPVVILVQVITPTHNTNNSSSSTNTNPKPTAPGPEIDHFAIYASSAKPGGGSDTNLRIIARGLKYSIEKEYADIAAAEQAEASASHPDAAIPANNNMDCKVLVQQVVLAALRLRGIRRADPEFKQFYQLLFKTAIFSLRKKSPAEINVNVVQEKVESLLSVME